MGSILTERRSSSNAAPEWTAGGFICVERVVGVWGETGGSKSGVPKAALDDGTFSCLMGTGWTARTSAVGAAGYSWEA